MVNFNVLINLLTNDWPGSSSQTAHNQEYPNYFGSFHTNYIIFRNVEFFNFFQMTKKIEGKKKNLQEYFICWNENFKIN
jgi:hypothetical protein